MDTSDGNNDLTDQQQQPIEEAPGCCSRHKKGIAIIVYYVLSVVSLAILFAVFESSWFGGDIELILFAKPHVSFCVYLGMTFCFIVYMLVHCVKKSRGKSVYKIPGKVFGLLIVPSVCQLLVLIAINHAISYAFLSVIRSFSLSLPLFTALFSFLFRKKRMSLTGLLGTGIVLFSSVVLCVLSFFGHYNFVIFSSSDSSFFSSDEPDPLFPYSAGEILLAIGLVLVCQILTATQTIIEEKVLHDLKAPPVLVVGIEGLYTFILTSAVILPFEYEWFWIFFDTLFEHFVLLLGLIFYVGMFVICSVFGVEIVQTTSASTRNMVEAVNMVIMWTIFIFYNGFFCYYCPDSFSIISVFEMVFFVVLIFGVLVYGEIIKLPFRYTSGAYHPINGRAMNAELCPSAGEDNNPDNAPLLAQP